MAAGVGHGAALGISAGVGAGEANTAVGSKEGLRDWTRRRKEETVLAVAVSAEAGAMRAVRPCGSDRAAAGSGGGEEKAGVEAGTGLGLGLGLGFEVEMGLGRGLGGGGRGGERRRGGEVETSERREPSERSEPSESESAAWGGEYIRAMEAVLVPESVVRAAGEVEELEGDFGRTSRQAPVWKSRETTVARNKAVFFFFLLNHD